LVADEVQLCDLKSAKVRAWRLIRFASTKHGRC
jgi:hypothetical protein